MFGINNPYRQDDIPNIHKYSGFSSAHTSNKRFPMFLSLRSIEPTDIAHSLQLDFLHLPKHWNHLHPEQAALSTRRLLE